MPDERYGVSVDQHLVDTYVIEGDAMLQRYRDNQLILTCFTTSMIFQMVLHSLAWTVRLVILIGENECPDDVQGQNILRYPIQNLVKRCASIVNAEDGSYDSFEFSTSNWSARDLQCSNLQGV